MSTIQTIKENLMSELASLIAAKKEDIESGLDEGIYENNEENKTELNRLNEVLKDLETYKNYSPSVYLFIEGGSIQGASGTEGVSINVYDKDLYKYEAEYEEDNGTPEAWDENIVAKTEAGELIPIY